MKMCVSPGTRQSLVCVQTLKCLQVGFPRFTQLFILFNPVYRGNGFQKYSFIIYKRHVGFVALIDPGIGADTDWLHLDNDSISL